MGRCKRAKVCDLGQTEDHFTLFSPFYLADVFSVRTKTHSSVSTNQQLSVCSVVVGASRIRLKQ